MKKYLLKRGYFGQHGDVYINKFQAWFSKYIIGYAVYIEEDGKQIWWDKRNTIKNWKQ